MQHGCFQQMQSFIPAGLRCSIHMQWLAQPAKKSCYIWITLLALLRLFLAELTMTVNYCSASPTKLLKHMLLTFIWV